MIDIQFHASECFCTIIVTWLIRCKIWKILTGAMWSAIIVGGWKQTDPKKKINNTVSNKKCSYFMKRNKNPLCLLIIRKTEWRCIYSKRVQKSLSWIWNYDKLLLCFIKRAKIYIAKIASPLLHDSVHCACENERQPLHHVLSSLCILKIKDSTCL